MSFVGFMKSPLGWLKIVVDDKGLKEIDFVYKRGKQEDKHKNITLVKKQLEEYFAGKRMKFKLPLSVSGSEFQTKVWRELARIPYGGVVRYADVAKWIGQPRASRAVGNANGKNPIPIVVPCHRVVASAGGLGGYSAGIDRKKWLLSHEKSYTHTAN